MASPSSAVTRPDLRAAVYQEWDAAGERAGFIADRVLPIIDVPYPSASYKMIPREEYIKDVDTLRKGSGHYTESTFSFSESYYRTQDYGTAERIDANAQATLAEFFDAEMAATAMVLSRLLRDQEKKAAALLFSATTFSGKTAAIGGANWATHATAVPINDILTARVAVRDQCGIWPNSLVLSNKVWLHLIACDQIIDRLGYGGSVNEARIATKAVVAQLLDLRQIIVGDAIKDTAKEGHDMSASAIWNEDAALVALINPAPRMQAPTLGMTWHWPGDGSEAQFHIEKYWDEDSRSFKIRGRRQTGQEVRDAAFGYYLTTVLTKGA